jgi:2-keto-4-pentenoate hydratase/2-oxohepta-3-ene-1,7-dioic acid hydratase in catechol pathway
MANATHTARIFCIGQNYVAHIRKLSNPMPQKPVIFMRPLSCLVAPGDIIYTGTPSGVGPLQIGDVIEVENDQIGTFSWTIIV